MNYIIVADPGFPVGGRRPRRGAPTPEVATFRKFVYQNERIWTLRVRAPAAPPGSANALVSCDLIYDSSL